MDHVTGAISSASVTQIREETKMGWYLEHILMHRDEIRATKDIDSDEFNDLLSIEKIIDTFIKNNLFNEREYEILRLMIKYRSANYVSELTGIDRITITRVFRSVVYRLSVVLGGIFTDEGYLDYMRNKYKLNDEQIDILQSYMKSKFKHDILTKPYEENRI